MRARPIARRETMQMVMRLTQAIRAMQFLRKRNNVLLQAIVARFALKYGVKVISIANAGNHLHFKVGSRRSYSSFTRATRA